MTERSTMAKNKKEREREILDEVYADRTFSEIEPHEPPFSDPPSPACREVWC